jgi:hypothetical protein
MLYIEWLRPNIDCQSESNNILLISIQEKEYFCIEMSSWNDQKQQFQKRYESITSYYQNELPQALNLLRTSLTNYVETGGVTQDNTDPNLVKAVLLYDGIQMQKMEFQNLNQDMSTAIGTMSNTLDTGRLLHQNGTLQQDIQSLEKKKAVVENDASSAELREKALRFQNKDVNQHQLFMVNAPVSRTAIPYLWALSFAFVAVGLLVFTQLIPPISLHAGVGTATAASAGVGQYILAFFKDTRVWMSLTGASVIVIIFLALKVANVI